jgi:hypothetical protein
MTKSMTSLIEVDTSEAIKKAQRILSELNNKQLIYAQRRVLKRLAMKAATATARETAKEEKMPVKLMRERLKLSHMNLGDNSTAQIRVFRTNVPASRLGVARTQLAKRGKATTSSVARSANGQYAKREISGQTSIRVGRRVFHNVFMQQLRSGKWHILRRLTEKRYPVEVVTVPINTSITRHATNNFQRAVGDELPQQMLRELVYRIDKVTNG